MLTFTLLNASELNNGFSSSKMWIFFIAMSFLPSCSAEVWKHKSQSQASCVLQRLTIIHHYPRLEVFKLQSQTIDVACMPWGKDSQLWGSRHDVAQWRTPTLTSDKDWKHLEKPAGPSLTPIYSSLIIQRCRGPKLLLRLGKAFSQAWSKCLLASDSFTHMYIQSYTV